MRPRPKYLVNDKVKLNTDPHIIYMVIQYFHEDDTVEIFAKVNGEEVIKRVPASDIELITWEQMKEIRKQYRKEHGMEYEEPEEIDFTNIQFI